ncbi:MAG: PorT family protein [Cyclobacteriaceae bacterium]|nr:PorT family protein [Cyclobacteriaceae bacterium]
MKKLSILFVLLTLSGAAALAQSKIEISVVAGPSFTSFVGADAEDWGTVGEKPNMAFRFHGGAILNYAINDKLDAISGLQYSVKGAVYKGTEMGQQGNFTAKYSKVLSYIDIPLSLQYSFSEKFALQGGTQVSILASAKVRNSEEVQDQFNLPATEDVKKDYKGIDLCLNIGPIYSISDKLSVQLLYQHGLLKIGQYTDHGANVSYNVMNQGFKLSLVYVVKE